jgi:hypothetical protein
VLTNLPFGGREEDGIENNFPTFRTKESMHANSRLQSSDTANEGRALFGTYGSIGLVEAGDPSPQRTSDEARP